jgi:hypothetical protein
MYSLVRVVGARALLMQQIPLIVAALSSGLCSISSSIRCSVKKHNSKAVRVRPYRSYSTTHSISNPISRFMHIKDDHYVALYATYRAPMGTVA